MARKKAPATLLAFAAIVLSLLVLLLIHACPAYGFFQVRPPLLRVSGVRAADVSKITLHKGGYYVVTVQSDAVAPFGLFFAWQNHQTSKAMVIGLTPLDSPHKVQSVVQAPEDTSAAALTVASLSGATPPTITFRTLQVVELRSYYYLFRNALRVICYLTFFGAAYYLLRRLYRRLSLSPTPPRVAVIWAVFLLSLGGVFDACFLKLRHEGLFDTPFKSSIVGWDGSFYYFWLRSAMVDRDLDFTNDVLYCSTLSLAHRQAIVRDTPRTATGLLPNKYPIGFALLSAPWYLLGSLSAHLANLLGEQVPCDGWGPYYQFFLVLGQIGYATMGLYLSYEILKRYFAPAVAICAVMFGWLGSPLFFYQTLDVFMSHNVMFFAMAGAYYFSIRLIDHPEKRIFWLLIGLLSAFVVLARYQGAIMLLFPGAVCVREVMRDRRRLAGFMIAIVAGSVPLALQMLAWKAVFGSYFLYTYQGETFSWRHPHLYEVLFSPFHGLFNWHPIMLVGFAGFLTWAIFARQFFAGWCFAISLALAIYINAAWDCWWFGASFGSRAFETCTLFSMLGLGYLLSLIARRSLAFHALALALVVGVLWNMNMVWLVFDNRLPLEKPVSWRERIDVSYRYWSRSG